MKFPRVAAAIVVFGVAITFADSPRLTQSDIDQIKRLCRNVVGLPAAKMYPVIKQFAPYLRTKDEFERGYWDCSSQHCTGTLKLRDAAALIYDFPHIPDPKDPLALVPDAVEKGNNRISFAGLVRHGTLVFTVPPGVKPNLWRFHLTNR
jgi:hypothetical protein